MQLKLGEHHYMITPFTGITEVRDSGQYTYTEYVNGLRHGRELRLHNDKIQSFGYSKNNKAHGSWISTLDGGTRIHRFKQGVYHGIQLIYDDNQLLLAQFYLHGLIKIAIPNTESRKSECYVKLKTWCTQWLLSPDNTLKKKLLREASLFADIVASTELNTENILVL